jgi:A/G-specific adenine glycosylase
VRRSILRWGAENRRDLPWRRTRDPWAILVSEVMLQQTQAARVVAPFGRFVARFPDARACAAARPAEVVRAWAGLGYNRRALFLHRSAARIVECHGGQVPIDVAALRALPGVGEYTARAVLAFAFALDVGVVDTNVGRILARAVAGRALGATEAQALADRLVPPGRAWEFNQSLFDLGARYCGATTPDCGPCPLSRSCTWARAGWPLPDPAHRSAGVGRSQPKFAGSDRQGRGRLVAALRLGVVPSGDVAGSAGWAGDPRRARRVADEIVREGLARWRDDGGLELA